MKSFEDVASAVRRDEVGRATSIATPFGPRLLCYADLTASGRYLRFVETWLGGVERFYGNTHTSSSTTGRTMTRLREQAREVIRRSVNAGPEDRIVFVGSGSTAAVNKLVGLLGIRIPEPLEREYRLSEHIPAAERPVVFVGPYEHHSNELPWFESIADVVEVGLDAAGHIDRTDLEANLARYRERRLRIGSFSAASNVTGILTDVREIARTLHRFGALAFFDFAAAAPHVPIDMNPPSPEERLDAIFLSTHKFIGGPGGSGVLLAREDLFRSRAPERPGGGTVDYVASYDGLVVDYVSSLEEREEGGTPAILGDIRAGIAFLLREAFGPERILRHETALAAQILARLSKHPRIRVYGPTDCPRLATFSFNIERLHHSFVSVLLDHLFGIQTRSGCSCAGPYGHRLLGIAEPASDAYRRLITEGLLGMKPGWVRFSIPPYFTGDDVGFVLRAVEFVADHGSAFLPLYDFGWRDGHWRHLEAAESGVESIELSDDALLKAASGEAPLDPERHLSEDDLREERGGYFRHAERLAVDLERRPSAERSKRNRPTGRPEVDSLVWFDYVHTDESIAGPPVPGRIA